MDRASATNRKAALGDSPTPAAQDASLDYTARTLLLPRSPRWREAVSTALLGDWCDPLWEGERLPTTALGALKAEARAVHHQLVPVWRHGTRAGRVLSLDADLGGLSLYDLVAPDVDLLTRATGGVFVDERLNTVLRGLDPAELAVVLAYAEGEGTTWAEAAAHIGAAGPEAFGERVRRKARRLAAEQARRTAQRRTNADADREFAALLAPHHTPAPAPCPGSHPRPVDSLPVGLLPVAER
ncbi:hypothetical protein [Streptomyces griseoruber]|uniref:hypothetical protein n=1 Tax=Streptomyces griseoruber TaxID=1943 RepID=UPI0012FE9D84|nr:hypothetical protein [Streptomyces griseoruber]